MPLSHLFAIAQFDLATNSKTQEAMKPLKRGVGHEYSEE